MLTYDYVCVKPKRAVFIILKPKLLDELDKGRKGIFDEFSVEKSTLSTINLLFYKILILQAFYCIHTALMSSLFV